MVPNRLDPGLLGLPVGGSVAEQVAQEVVACAREGAATSPGERPAGAWRTVPGCGRAADSWDSLNRPKRLAYLD